MTTKQFDTPDEQDTGQASPWSTGTVGEGLDRIENLVGRIGMNSPEQAQAVLTGLDVLSARIQAMENLASRKPLLVQRQAIIDRMRNEASGFIRDLGGVAALQALRAAHQPPQEHPWWYLDEWLAQRRRLSTRSMLRNLGIVVLVLVALALVYQFFLAPPPEVVALLDHQQNARDALMVADFDTVLAEVEQGLQYDPQDLELLVMKGVALESSGRAVEAEAAYEQALAQAESREVFLLTRAQSYLMLGNNAYALSSVEEVLAANPESPSGNLLAGQVYEAQGDYLRAYDSYDKASKMAEAQDEPELSAIARTRLAYLIQIMNAPQFPTEVK